MKKWFPRAAGLMTAAFLLSLFALKPSESQTTLTGRVTVATTSTLPAVCSKGDIAVTTDTVALYLCSPANTWSAQTGNVTNPNGNFTVGQIIAAVNSFSGIGSVSTFYVAILDPTVGDICAKINHLAKTVAPSTGIWISADGQGIQACGSNPFSGVGSIGVKLTFQGTQFHTTAQWILPASVTLDGGSRGSGTRGASIQAVSGFPNGTCGSGSSPCYIVEYGASLIQEGIHLMNFTLDANNIAFGCAEDQFAQELSDGVDIACINFFGTGLNLVGTGGGAQNSGSWKNWEFITGTSSTSTTLCFQLNNVPSMRRVEGFTCTMNLFTVQPNYGIMIDVEGYIQDGQCQVMAIACVFVGSNTSTSGGVWVVNLHGNSAPVGVWISSAHNVQNYFLFGIANFGTDQVHDGQIGCTSGTGALGLYSLGMNDGSGHFVLLSGSNVSGCQSNFGFNGLATTSITLTQNNYPFAFSTAPTISSGFGTSPAIVNGQGPHAFVVNIGSGGTASSGVIGLPTAVAGWSCTASDLTTPGPNNTKESATSATSVTFTNYNNSGSVAAWTANDFLRVICFPY